MGAKLINGLLGLWCVICVRNKAIASVKFMLMPEGGCVVVAENRTVMLGTMDIRALRKTLIVP